jgi:hypothetical protein
MLRVHTYGRRIIGSGCHGVSNLTVFLILFLYSRICLLSRPCHRFHAVRRSHIPRLRSLVWKMDAAAAETFGGAGSESEATPTGLPQIERCIKNAAGKGARLRRDTSTKPHNHKSKDRTP